MSLGPDLALDPTTNDLAVVNGDLALTVDVTQAVAIRLRFFQNDWFLNTAIGLPYFEQIFVKQPRLNLIEALYRDEISQCPGIDSVDSVAVELNAETREATVEWTATSEADALSGITEVS